MKPQSQKDRKAPKSTTAVNNRVPVQALAMKTRRKTTQNFSPQRLVILMRIQLKFHQ
jgi:hypothetical protein